MSALAELVRQHALKPVSDGFVEQHSSSSWSADAAISTGFERLQMALTPDARRRRLEAKANIRQAARDFEHSHGQELASRTLQLRSGTPRGAAAHTAHTPHRLRSGQTYATAGAVGTPVQSRVDSLPRPADSLGRSF